MTRVNTLKDIEKIYLESRFRDTDVEDEVDTREQPGEPDYETGDERWDRLHRDEPEVVAGYRRGLGRGYKDIQKTAQSRYDKEKEEQRKSDERELQLMRAMQKFGHGTDYSTPFEETDHSKDAPALAPGDKRHADGSVTDKDGKVVYKPKTKVAKEGTKGTQSDREKADVDDDGDLEPWEKKRANAIRKSQGKSHLCAKTVTHEQYGPGHTVHARHAHPDVNGNIEWYVCEFKHGTEVVNTEDVDIVTIVEHSHD